MRIPQNIILIWAGAHASIPSNWTRETLLDGKYIKGASTDADPNSTGGNATHTHTSTAHSHTIAHTHSFNTGNAGSVQSNHALADYPQCVMSTDVHYHSGTSGASNAASSNTTSALWGAMSNNPPFHEVIFIKANIGAQLADDIIALYDKSTIPNNWQLCNGDSDSPDLRNKYLKGAAADQDAGTTGGSTQNVHDISHSHTIPIHSHTGVTTTSSTYQYCDRADNTQPGNRANCTHQHSVTFQNSSLYDAGTKSITNTTSETVEPGYKKLIAIQKKTNGLKVKGIIGLWLGGLSTIPRGWILCDGRLWPDRINRTPDMRERFIKIANETSEIGNTGGSNTHSHASYSHNHTFTGHTHVVVTTSGHPTDVREVGNNGGANILSNISHANGTAASANISSGSNDIDCNSSDNQPEYRTVAYIQFVKEIYSSAALANFLS